MQSENDKRPGSQGSAEIGHGSLAPLELHRNTLKQVSWELSYPTPFERDVIGKREKPMNIKKFSGTSPLLDLSHPVDVSRLSRGNVPSVPWTFCPIYVTLRRNHVGASWIPSLGHFRGIPTTKALHVFFVRTVREETKGRFRKRAVLANVPYPSSGFWCWGTSACTRSRSWYRGTSECTLVLVFGAGEHPPKPPFWKPPFCEPPICFSFFLLP